MSCHRPQLCLSYLLVMYKAKLMAPFILSLSITTPIPGPFQHFREQVPSSRPPSNPSASLTTAAPGKFQTAGMKRSAETPA